MLAKELISPQSIAIIGASDNIEKPGGKVLKNLLEHGFQGSIYAVNPKQLTTSGVVWVESIGQIQSLDLAILAISAHDCFSAIQELLKIGTKAFIIYSAGFSEIGDDGRLIEIELEELISEAGATLIGPNCIGVIQESYKGVFTTPIPAYHKDGCEMVSSSGATAVFIMEAAVKNGLRFSNIYSIGNGTQTGVEEILEYMNLTYSEGISPKIKLLYLETIRNPFKFIKHTTSLINKGCQIAAIKAGVSEAGSRAASSHTGALASSDAVIRALFRKCGIVYCSGREELISVAGIFQTKKMNGDNIAIVTHAGGSAVMLTDALTINNLNVPHLEKSITKGLLTKLNPGSSVDNPIDFLATGTAEQLSEIIDFCEAESSIDAIVVVFGSPGLINVRKVYEVLLEKMESCTKPIYPVLPSVINAAEEIKFFLACGKVNFPDEVVLGQALAHVYNTPKSTIDKIPIPEMDIFAIRSIINAAPQGYLNAELTNELLIAAGINNAQQFVCKTTMEVKVACQQLKKPYVLKVVGPVHKTEVNGIRLNIINDEQAFDAFNQLMQVVGAKSVLVQEMHSGEELYCGAARQGGFGHLVICGLGGIFLELLNDTSSSLAPISESEAHRMIHNLKAYPIIEGYRNKEGINENKFNELIRRVAALVQVAPEISELDLNPIKASMKELIVVDARIKIDSYEKY